MNPNTSISTIMTQSTLSVKPDDSLATVQSIFKNYSFHHIPVITDDHSVVGIISKIDLLTFTKRLSTETSGKSYSHITIKNTKAKDIMIAEPTSIDPDDSIGLAADIFLANTIHSLPVVEDNKLVGIVTTHDLLKYAFKSVLYNE